MRLASYEAVQATEWLPRQATITPSDAEFEESSCPQWRRRPAKLLWRSRREPVCFLHKNTGEDTVGALSAFELQALPQTGPFLHVHHREDEWHYVLSGAFIFKAGDESFQAISAGIHFQLRSRNLLWVSRTCWCCRSSLRRGIRNPSDRNGEITGSAGARSLGKKCERSRSLHSKKRKIITKAELLRVTRRTGTGSRTLWN